MAIYESEFQGATIDARLAAVATMQTAISNLETAVAAKYSKPSSGIPETDLDASVQAALALARTAIQSLSDYYTKAQVDDIAAAIAASVDSTSGVVVTTLPSAGAGTLGKIYYVGPDANGFYDRYVTSYDGSTYTWLALGNTEVDMTQYATVEQLNQLDLKAAQLETSADLSDLVLADLNGNALAVFQNGDFMTKNFNSAALSSYRGKKLSILGDSISSFLGYIDTGDGWGEATYPRGDVQNVNQMWYKMLADILGMTVLRTQSNPGGCVTDGIVTNRICASSDERTSALGDGVNLPDVIIVEGGLNDFYTNAPLGTYDGTTPLDTSKINTFRDAYANMLRKLQTNYPDAKIFCGIPHLNWHSGYVEGPVPCNSFGTYFSAYVKAIKEIADLFGCPLIRFDLCGINLQNGADYTVDGSTLAFFHPNYAGMKLYLQSALKSLV